MFERNGIILNQVSNGWVVILPMMPPSFDTQFGLVKPQFRELGKLIRGEEEEDPVLAKIYEENDKKPEPQSDKLNVPKDENTFIFATFPEVLEFLKNKIN